jgi:hypothetical protein
MKNPIRICGFGDKGVSQGVNDPPIRSEFRGSMRSCRLSINLSGAIECSLGNELQVGVNFDSCAASREERQWCAARRTSGAIATGFGRILRGA